jgi:hypothetical protein
MMKKEVTMETPPIVYRESNDKKEIVVIVAIGVIVIICICFMLAVAGYFLYKDLNSSSKIEAGKTPEVVTATTQATKEQLLFADNFDSNANQWNEGSFDDEYGKTTFVINGKYVWDIVAKKGVNQKSWAENAPSVKDFIASIDATHVSGAENASYGILFRIKDTNNLYYFAISDLGYYYAGSLTDGKWTTLIDWTETKLIHVNATNALKVIGIGDELTFYINDAVVDRIQDNAHTEGTSGIGIELYDAGAKSNFEFDNFILTTP